jgi:hypothetical protein
MLRKGFHHYHFSKSLSAFSGQLRQTKGARVTQITQIHGLTQKNSLMYDISICAIHESA